MSDGSCQSHRIQQQRFDSLTAECHKADNTKGWLCDREVSAQCPNAQKNCVYKLMQSAVSVRIAMLEKRTAL